MPSYKKSNAGRAAAEQHIREAEELSKELGGTDKDVKKWLFSRSSGELNMILSKYRNKFGDVQADYATETFQDWKSGRRKMSGRVASRFYSILPPMMPMNSKFELVESLWEHVGPKKRRVVEAGLNSDKQEVISVVRSEIEKLTTKWTVPKNLTNRFNWLSQNDSTTYQKLLSHIKESERQLGLQVIENQVPILMEKFERDWQSSTHRLSYIIDVGKQSVEIRLSGESDSVIAKDWYLATQRNSTSTDDSIDPITIAIIIGVIIFLAGLF